MLFYRAAVDLSRSTLNYVAGLIRRHRKKIGSAWRLLNPGQQALLVLVGRGRRSGRTVPNRERSADIRNWAKENGITINDRGRIPTHIVEDYDCAH